VETTRPVSDSCGTGAAGWCGCDSDDIGHGVRTVGRGGLGIPGDAAVLLLFIAAVAVAAAHHALVHGRPGPKAQGQVERLRVRVRVAATGTAGYLRLRVSA